MAETITPEDVKDGFATSLPDSELAMLISLVDQADDCLDSKQVPADVQRALKLYAVRHGATLQANEGRGSVTSERAPSGAGRSFAGWQFEGGSPYWKLLKQLDRTGCVVRIFEQDRWLGAWSVGG